MYQVVEMHDILACQTYGISGLTFGKQYGVESFQIGSLSPHKDTLFISSDHGKALYIYDKIGSLTPIFNNSNFNLIKASQNIALPHMLQHITLAKPMSDTLVTGNVYQHKNNGNQYWYDHKDTNTSLYHFDDLQVRAKCCFDRSWVDLFLQPLPRGVASRVYPIVPIAPPWIPSGLLPGQAMVPQSWSKQDAETFFSNESKPEPKRPKVIYEVCRVCGTKGNANIANNKVFYYCVKCKDEC